MRSPKSPRIKKIDSSRPSKDFKAALDKSPKVALVYREASPEAVKLGEQLIKKLLKHHIRFFTGPGQKAL
ncbi:MAG: hypothetical protein WCH11_06315, partial [Bdellovibrio sp.]